MSCLRPTSRSSAKVVKVAASLPGMLRGLVAGSFVVVWRKWKHRAGLGSAKLGSLAVLPRSWQRWGWVRVKMMILNNGQIYLMPTHSSKPVPLPGTASLRR